MNPECADSQGIAYYPIETENFPVREQFFHSNYFLIKMQDTPQEWIEKLKQPEHATSQQQQLLILKEATTRFFLID